MNIKFIYSIALGFGLCAMASCSENIPEASEILQCEVSVLNLDFESGALEKTVEVKSETDWMVTIDQGSADWLSVSPMEGVGDQTLTLKANSNKDKSSRSAIVYVVAKGAELQSVKIQQAGSVNYIYDFSNLDGFSWQGGVGEFIYNAECKDGRALSITTAKGSKDRIKAASKYQFGSGKYIWRLFVSDMGLNDQASIGAFIYNNDAHELDFEIGSGTSANRSKYNAKDDEVLCYATSQANPHVQKIITIKKNAWHTVMLDMALEGDKKGGKYVAKWLVDGEPMLEQKMNFGEEVPFTSIVSVENLGFMGNHLPKQDTYGLFDYFEYQPYNYSMKPVSDDMIIDPEPEGDVFKWDFEDVIPDEWNNNKCLLEGGWLVMTNGTSISYKDPVGPGKYTWKVDVPAIGNYEKALLGGNLYAYIDGAEYSFSMFTGYGSKGDREACEPAPRKDQMILRCYSEAGAMFVPLDPGKHEFVIDVRNIDGKYVAQWFLDGEFVRVVRTAYDVNKVKFGLSTNFFADGGGWQGDNPTSQTYIAKYDYIEYKKYDYSK